jgi:hypothetical protein
MTIDNYGRAGVIKEGNDVFTFTIGQKLDTTIPGVINFDEFPGYAKPLIYQVGQFNVLFNGDDNLMPQEVKTMIGGNRLLPELIEKQIRFLYGKGPGIYIDDYASGKPERKWVSDQRIFDWLDSWHTNGLKDNYQIYFNKVIRDFYYMESHWSRWRFTAARRIAGDMPVAGLEHISQTRCRFGTKRIINQYADDFEDSDFQFILVGNWNYPTANAFKIYRRFDHANPLAYSSAISYSKNPSFGEEVYAYNSFYKGVKEWIIGQSRTPKNINSFIENSLAARLHIIIPVAWYNTKKEYLEQICKENLDRQAESKTLVTLKVGDDVIDVGTEFREELMTKYVNSELKKISKVLSGEGNQGKLYASFKYNPGTAEEKWEFVEIPMKYKEYIDALVAYDARADNVLLSSKGVDASLSNITKEGVISKSGADAYYNYIIYLSNLTIAEYVTTQDINFALRINFPEEYASGKRIGFYSVMPARQEDISSQNRIQNQK